MSRNYAIRIAMRKAAAAMLCSLVLLPAFSASALPVQASSARSGSAGTVTAEAAEGRTSAAASSKSASTASGRENAGSSGSATGATTSAAAKKAAAEADKEKINFTYVEKDIASWKAVYQPVLENNGTLASIGDLPRRNSLNQEVGTALNKIYTLLTDTRRSSSVLRTDKALILYDVLNGNYTRKAVEAFLDHGYFTDYYADLKKAGLVEASYQLPAHPYHTTVLGETVSVPRGDGTSVTYRMIKTDSDYLDAEQLLVVAQSTKDKKTTHSLEQKIASFEEDYVPKFRQ